MAEETESAYYNTYDIKGIPPPRGLTDKTDNIPYVPGTPARVNIEALASEKEYRDQWTLFVLGLEKFKARPVREKLSYFRIAGIHMAPAQPWDGADKPSTKASDGHSVGGYCFHNALNFPNFHRPYMLLFEQLVWENMKEVIGGWVSTHGMSESEADKWYDAANAWRLPYWDWAAKQSYVDNFACPEILTLPTVRIFPPESLSDLYPQPKKYPNPFWDFENPQQDDDGNPLPFGQMPAHVKDFNIPEADGIPWDKTSGTSRYGLFREQSNLAQGLGPAEVWKYHGLKGVNNVWQVNTVLSSMKTLNEWYKPKTSDKGGPDTTDKDRYGHFVGPGTLADAVSRMLSDGYHSTYEQFSTTKWYGSKETQVASGYLSLEYIHNNIHNLTGGDDWATGMGNMADVSVAAFDPVFWLHHCNVDRLFAIWQALNWQKWWDGSASSDHPDKSDTDNRYSSLEPFHFKYEGLVETYASDTCRDWTKLGYSYDDLDKAATENVLDKDGKLTESLYIAALRKNLNALYPSSAHAISALRRSDRMILPGLGKPEDHGGWDGGPWHDYIINVDYDRYALGGKAYSIEFHLGGDRDDPSSVWSAKNFVGKVYTFSNNQMAACPNCTTQQEEGVLSRAQIPLTLHLLHHALDDVPGHNLDSFVKDDVEKYLVDKLQWRFVEFGGTEVPASKFPKTEVEVFVGHGEVLRPEDRKDEDKENNTAKFSNYASLLRASNGVLVRPGGE